MNDVNQVTYRTSLLKLISSFFRRNSCGVGKVVEFIINIANVNDRPSPRPIDSRNPNKLRLVHLAPALPYKLKNDAANEGFTIKKFGGKGMKFYA